MKALYRGMILLAVAALGGMSSSVAYADADSPDPVLMVISNQDFWYQDYADTRAALSARGLRVVVAAATTDRATPQFTGGPTPPFVRPDLALADVDAEDYSAIVFSGGWGMAQYQYGFEGTYHNTAYRRNPFVTATVNDLIEAFLRQDKPVAAICYGVSVLAYARVDGDLNRNISLIRGRAVAAWAGTVPGFTLDQQDYPDGTVPTRWQIEENGVEMALSAAPGNPVVLGDDVVVDGNIITAENFLSAPLFGKTIAAAVLGPRKSDPQR